MTDTVQTFRFSGDIRIGRYTSKTAFGGFIDAINFEELSITLDGDTLTQIDNGITYYGQAKSINYQPKPTKVQATLDEINKEIMADFLRGTLSTFSQTADTDQTATVTLVLNKWVDLGTMNIDTVTISTLTEGEDYEVDKTLGQVKALTQGATGEKTVTFDRGVIAGNKILVAGNASPIYYALKGRVKNHNTGEIGVLDIPQISIDPKEAFTFIGGKGNQTAKFEGFAVVLAGSPLFTFYPDLALTAVPEHV